MLSVARAVINELESGVDVSAEVAIFTAFTGVRGLATVANVSHEFVEHFGEFKEFETVVGFEFGCHHLRCSFLLSDFIVAQV